MALKPLFYRVGDSLPNFPKLSDFPFFGNSVAMAESFCQLLVGTPLSKAI